MMQESGSDTGSVSNTSGQTRTVGKSKVWTQSCMLVDTCLG